MPAETIPGAPPAGPPLHGFRGDAPLHSRSAGPRGLTIAISRQSGARGTTVARKLGELLGWQVFDQETIDYLLVDDTGRAQLLVEIPDGARAWAEASADRLLREHQASDDTETAALVRLVLLVAARGEAVIVGRGAGFLLPPESTLHARIVAPIEARVGYMAQALRLTLAEAATEVRDRDDRRAKFLTRTVHRDGTDPTAYDVVVNSARLGVEAAAQFIGWGLRTKQMFAELGSTTGPPDDEVNGV